MMTPRALSQNSTISDFPVKRILLKTLRNSRRAPNSVKQTAPTEMGPQLTGQYGPRQPKTYVRTK